MMQEIEEYKERIRTLEEEVQFYKGDRTNVQEFRISIKGVRKELHNLAKEMYVGVQEFQKKASQILTQLEKTKTKNMEFIGIRVGLDEMKKWAEDNPNALEVLPRMIDWESELNYVSLSNYQQIGKNGKGFKNSLGICSKLHRETIILSIKCHLPQIGELGQPSQMIKYK
jgi:hypothetical protein